MSKKSLYTIIIILLVILGGITGTYIIPNDWKYLFGFCIGALNTTLIFIRTNDK